MPNFGLDKLGATTLTTAANKVLKDTNIASGLNATKALQANALEAFVY